MRTSDLILQLVVPALTFVLGLYLQRFIRPRRGDIAVVPIKSAILKSDFIDDFEGLKITLDDSPIDTGLGWISGVITVRGTNQIERNQIRKPLTLTLPDDWQWRRFYIEPHVSKAAGVIDKSNPRECAIEWDALHEREVLRFSALVHSDSPEALREGFSKLPALLDVSGRVSDARVVVVSAEETRQVFSGRDLVVGIPFLLLIAMTAVLFFIPDRERVYLSPVRDLSASVRAQNSYQLAFEKGDICAIPEGTWDCQKLVPTQVNSTLWKANVRHKANPFSLLQWFPVAIVAIMLAVGLLGKYRDYRNHSLLTDRVIWFRIPWRSNKKKTEETRGAG